jgi:hypothetical protein
MKIELDKYDICFLKNCVASYIKNKNLDDEAIKLLNSLLNKLERNAE